VLCSIPNSRGKDKLPVSTRLIEIPSPLTWHRWHRCCPILERRKPVRRQ
jgi:hypothetical protein